MEIKTDLAKQLSNAVNKLHGMGVFHGDLKPGNITVLEEDGDYILKLIFLKIIVRTYSV